MSWEIRIVADSDREALRLGARSTAALKGRLKADYFERFPDVEGQRTVFGRIVLEATDLEAATAEALDLAQGLAPDWTVATEGRTVNGSAARDFRVAEVVFATWTFTV